MKEEQIKDDNKKLEIDWNLKELSGLSSYHIPDTENQILILLGKAYYIPYNSYIYLEFLTSFLG